MLRYLVLVPQSVAISLMASSSHPPPLWRFSTSSTMAANKGYDLLWDGDFLHNFSHEQSVKDSTGITRPGCGYQENGVNTDTGVSRMEGRKKFNCSLHDFIDLVSDMIFFWEGSNLRSDWTLFLLH